MSDNYFPDGSSFRPFRGPNGLAMGWLDAVHQYRKGKVL